MLFCVSHYLAQNKQTYSNYTTQNGLPSNETYSILQDQNGYVWIATDRGVARHDGYSISTYSTEDGLAHNTILRMKMGKDGVLWCFALDGSFSYYKNHSFTPFEKNYQLEEFYDQNPKIRSEISDFFFDKNGQLQLVTGNHDHNLWVVTDSGVHKNNLSEYESQDANIVVHLDEFQKAMIIQNKESSTKEIKIQRLQDKLFLKLPLSEKQGLRMLNLRDGNYFFLTNNKAWIFDEQKVIDEINHSNKLVTAVFQDKEEKIWFLLKNEDPKIYDPRKREWVSIPQELKGIQLNWMEQDYEGNIWMSTQEHGVKVLKETAFATIDETQDNKIVAFRKFEDKLYASSSTAELYRYDNGLFTPFFKPLKNNIDTRNVSDFIFANKSILSFASLLNSFELSGKQILAKRKSIKCIHRLSDSLCFMGSNQGLLKYNFLNDQMVHLDPENFAFRTNAICPDENGVYWLGSTEGLYFLKNDKIEKDRSYHQQVGRRILDLQIRDGAIYIATKGKGIVRKENDSIRVYKKSDGLISDMYDCVFAQDDKHIWAGSRVGLSYLVLDSAYNLIKIKNFTANNGLPSNEINDIIFEDGLIWIASSNGVVSLDPIKIDKPYSDPKLNIEQIKVSNQVIELGGKLELEHHQNNLDINYTGVNFASGGDLRYRYRLRGLSDTWQESKERKVSFQNLPPGHYAFEIHAANQDNIWTAKPTGFQFRIQRHLFQKWWFRLLLLLLLFLLGFLLLKRHNINQKLKYEMRSRMVELQQLALSNSMNPHFIFNALNSIQSNMIQGKIDDANQMLVRFSKLIRLNLQHRHDPSTSLRETIKSLELYLETEKIRVGDKLKYNIEIYPEVDLDWRIPSMILQPFVENAIWHGVLPKNGGVIDLSFKIENQQLIIEIEDDGLGLNKGSQSKQHISLSTKLTRERIKLLTQSTGKKYSLSLTDKKEDEKDGEGTRVVFSFPVSARERE